ncbi:MAG: molecular chaperone DnaJ [Longimicrobiaceae bacterium]
MAVATKDYYRILGVAENAGSGEVKRAYRTLAKKHHPDANPGDTAAAERFKEISEAYSVLSDGDKRKQYDRMRRYGGFGPGDFGGRERPGTAPGGGVSFEFGGLGDLFNSIFDRTRRREPPGPERGQSVEYAVEIPFETAARGGKIPVTVPVTEGCRTCDGSGARPGSTPTQCPECKGRGTVSFGQGGFMVTRPCPACYGRGTIATDPCPTCDGRGEVRRHRRLEVTVPPGVDTGSKVRLGGQGGAGARGGPAGDLIVSFRVRPHRFFKREGLDIHCTVPINVAQATLGSKLRVRTLEGKRVVLKVPPGTQSGTRFRLPRLGIRKGGQTGDQFVRVQVRVPDKLDAREEEIMREFAQEAEMKY